MAGTWWTRQSFRLVFFFLAYWLAVEAPRFLNPVLLDRVPFWPASGLLLAVLLLTEPWSWPFILTIAFGADVLCSTNRVGLPLAAALALGATRILEAAVGGWLVRRYANDAAVRLDDLKNVLILVLLLGLCNTTIGATGTVSTYHLILGERPPWSLWVSWWVAGFLGILLVCPLLLVWWIEGLAFARELTTSRWLEAVLLLTGQVLVTETVFGGRPDATRPLLDFPYILFPFLIYAALQFGLLGATTASFLLAIEVAWNTGQGRGPFALIDQSPVNQIAVQQAYLAVASLSALVFAVVNAGRQMERQLRELNEQYRDLFENVNDLIQSVGPDGRFQYVNQAWQKALGYNEVESSRLTIYDILQPDCVSGRPGLFQRWLAGEDLERIELRFVSRYGRVIIVEGSSTWVHAQGRPLATRGIFHDITERKMAEEQLAASLQEKEVLLREVHHRVKNNLQVISSLLSLQCRANPNSPALPVLQESRDRLQAMTLIHEQLYRVRDFARIELGGYVRTLVSDLIRSYRIAPSVIRIDTAIQGIILPVGQAIPCALILNELLTNCLKHAFPDGRKGSIRVICRLEADGEYVLEVSDDGVGIPASVDLQKTRSLGLRLVRALAEQLHGTVAAWREAGTTIAVRFPVDPGETPMRPIPPSNLGERGLDSDQRPLSAI